MSSSPATGPSAELIRYTHASTRIGRTCTPCVTPMFPATRGSAHRLRTARIGCLACTHGNSSASPEEESATARPDKDPASTGAAPPARTVRTGVADPQARDDQRSREAGERMARLIYSAIASLDGYVEDTAGAFAWSGPRDEGLRLVHTP